MKVTANADKGRIHFDPVGLAIAAREYDGKRLVVDISPERPVRSVKANRRYFGVLVPLAGHCLNNHESREGLPPLSKLQIHGVLVRAFLGEEVTPLGPVPMETHTLDSHAFAHFTKQVELWLAENGYAVPEGQEPVDLQDGGEAA